MPREAVDAARPHLLRAGALALIAIAGIVVARVVGQVSDVVHPDRLDPATPAEQAAAFGGALLLIVAGIAAVRSISSAVRDASAAVAADGRGGSLAFTSSLIGYLVVLIATLGTLGVPLQGVFLGGALTGVVLGIAAQQTIGNFFAGIVILVVRPFTIGDEVTLRSSPLGGLYEGRVTQMTLFYVHLSTAQGPVALPNALVLASAVGPGARTPP
jgi:small conductance mechanosensitive channel